MAIDPPKGRQLIVQARKLIRIATDLLARDEKIYYEAPAPMPAEPPIVVITGYMYIPDKLLDELQRLLERVSDGELSDTRALVQAHESVREAILELRPGCRFRRRLIPLAPLPPMSEITAYMDFAQQLWDGLEGLRNSAQPRQASVKREDVEGRLTSPIIRQAWELIRTYTDQLSRDEKVYELFPWSPTGIPTGAIFGYADIARALANKLGELVDKRARDKNLSDTQALAEARALVKEAIGKLRPGCRFRRRLIRPAQLSPKVEIGQYMDLAGRFAERLEGLYTAAQSQRQAQDAHPVQVSHQLPTIIEDRTTGDHTTEVREADIHEAEIRELE